MIYLLCKLPHTETYAQTMLDDDVYRYLLEEGWNFSINYADTGRAYVKLHRTVNGKREHKWLHRHIAVANYPVGHTIEIHHADHNSLNNMCENLQPLPQKVHRRIHAKRRKEVSQ